jgi:hypothetical protein
MSNLTHEEILQGLFKKIPELQHNKAVGLPGFYFERLTDLEFEIFYYMPGLIVTVSPKTMDYIEQRRVALKLKKTYYMVKK